MEIKNLKIDMGLNNILDIIACSEALMAFYKEGNWGSVAEYITYIKKSIEYLEQEVKKDVQFKKGYGFYLHL